MRYQAHNTIKVKGHTISVVWAGHTVTAYKDNQFISAVTYHGPDAHNKCANIYANTINKAFALRDKLGT